MFKNHKAEAYRPVCAEDTESLLPASDESTTVSSFQRHISSPYIINFSLAITVLLILGLGFCIGQIFPRHLDQTCTKHTSKYSPILDDVDISYNSKDFDGRFVKENIYRQVGSPEVDAAWEDLGVGYRSILLPASRRDDAGLTSDHAHAREKYGGGYPVYVEGLHQLHCLNLLRQSLYYNYDYYLAQGKEAFGDGPDVLHWHVSHCVDFIRQRLMCTMDTDVFGSVWVGNVTSASLFVDFNTKHVCKNFEDIRSWAEKNQMPELGPKDFWEPPDENTRISRWAP